MLAACISFVSEDNLFCTRHGTSGGQGYRTTNGTDIADS